MPDREKVIKGLECCTFILGKRKCNECPYQKGLPDNGCYQLQDDFHALLKDDETQLQYRDDHIAMYQAEVKRLEALLKEQGARVVTAADFENNPNLDDSKHLNVWEEYRDGTRCGWNTININDVITFTDIHRYWTSRPTEEQRKAVKWDGNYKAMR